MSSISKIQSLLTACNATTGQSRTDLTAGVQDLVDGYGGSTVTKGLVFSEYDSNGYPTKARFVGSWTSMPANYCHTLFWSNLVFTKNITSLSIPDTVTSIGGGLCENCKTLESVEFPNNNLSSIAQNAFNECNALKKINIKGDVRFAGAGVFKNCKKATEVTIGGTISTSGGIANNCFNGCVLVELYDFSHCAAIPSLYSVASLQYKSGCVIKIPSALSDTTLGTGNGWESASNWVGLTNITWQVV